MPTKSQLVAADIYALTRARCPAIWVTTPEETRAERYIAEAAMSANYIPMFWDIAQGTTNLAGLPVAGMSAPEERDPVTTMSAIASRARSGNAERGMFILRDLPIWLDGPSGALTLRALRNLAQLLPRPTTSPQAIVIISPKGLVPPELSSLVTVVEWPLPDREEIGAMLDASLEVAGDKVEQCTNGTRESAIDAAVGLTGDEAQSCFNRCLVQYKRVDTVAIANEKKQVIARERVIEWGEPYPGDLSSVGGLENAKEWLTSHLVAYTPKARAFGLPMPKGIFLTGVSGCGKTLLARVIATHRGVPFLKADLGALKGKFIGESEANLRRFIKVLEAIGPCVVLLDEIEKSLAGATQGAADGGVSADALGTLLTWMNDRTSAAFVIATANDVRSLPPELLRKGRFDELFFVDLPNAVERAAVLEAALKQFKRTADGMDGVLM
jgi:hypothetical protein